VSRNFFMSEEWRVKKKKKKRKNQEKTVRKSEKILCRKSGEISY
jgi:hypothetical protein